MRKQLEKTNQLINQPTLIKVLFISQWYPHRYDPMFGLFVQKHAEAVSLYANVAALYVHIDPSLNEIEIQTTTEKGFQEIRVYYPVGKNSISKQYNYLKAYKKGFDLLHESWGKPDIIQATVFTRTALIAALYKNKYGTPYTVIEHWTRYFRENTFRNSLHKYLSVWAASQAKAVMPVTKHLQNCMEQHGMMNDNYKIINNVVDNLFFERFTKPAGKKIRILNVTCFNDEQKNLSGLLNVVEKLDIKRQDFEIVLVGEGIDFSYIKELSHEKGLENTVVTFTGMLTGQNLVRSYQESDFTVLFSNYENIPVVISESFACGLPVISTNVGGIAEHIDKSNGLLIDAGDEIALFKAIDYMLDHYKEYDKEQLIEMARNKYSYQSVGNELISIYKNILEQ